MEIFLHILVSNIIPIYFIIILGYFLNRKFNLDINTMSKLNFYIFAPAFMFLQLYTTDIPLNMIKIVAFALALLFINYIAAKFISRMLNHDMSMQNAFSNSVMFYNSGNIGIPLITLVFSSGPFIINGQTPYLAIALTTQVLVLVTQNITINTLGFFNAHRGNTHWKHSIKVILQMPPVYAVFFGIIMKFVPYDLKEFPVWSSLQYFKDGLISVALLTLGVQLSKTNFNLKNSSVYLSNILRLIAGPLLAYLIVIIFNFNSIIAQALIISSAVPTAVTTALISVETGNEPDFASQAVFTSTAFSCITLSVVVYVSRVLFPVIG